MWTIKEEHSPSAAAIYFIIISEILSLSTELQKIVLGEGGGGIFNWMRYVPAIFQTDTQHVSYFQIMKSICCISAQHTE